MSTDHEIVLSKSEIELVAISSVRETLHSRLESFAEFGAQLYELGACNFEDWVELDLARYALCKYLGIFWADGNHDNSLKDAKMTVFHQHNHNADIGLVVGLNIADDSSTWSVAGGAGKYKILGWCFGVDAKRSEYLRQNRYGNQEYVVPKSALRNPDITAWEIAIKGAPRAPDFKSSCSLHFEDDLPF